MKNILHLIIPFFALLFLLALARNGEAIQGSYFQAGLVGSLDTGIGEGPKTLELGPGAYGAFGANGEIFGSRIHFLYTAMDLPTTNLTVETLGGGFDLKIMPLGRHPDIMLQPYFVAGIGFVWAVAELGNGNDGDPGFAGNVGIGADIHLTEHFSIAIENNLRPMLLHNDTNLGVNVNGVNFGINTYDLYLYTFMALATVHF